MANELNFKDKPTTMKTKIFTSTVTLLLCAFIFSSCSSSKSSTKKYPEEKSTTANPGNLPPGQAKKIYGTKSAKVFAPGQRKKHGKYYPLIIVRTPGIIILRHADGRYYYKNEDNYIYWQGSDDRFYLDEQHLEKVDYDKNELETWKAKGKASEKRSPGDEKKDDKQEPGKGKHNKKSKNH